MNVTARIARDARDPSDHPRWQRLLLACLALALIIAPLASAGQLISRYHARPEGLTAAEFARLITDLSEEGGYFRSDNFTSNETSYLHVVDKLRELGTTGGAYIGVGPEQNFTYIAKMRPRIAFIVDIRRQAMIQHLMLKAIFQLSENRAEFLSRLVSRPLTGEDVPGRGAPIDKILAYLSASPASEEYFTANLASIRKLIQNDLQFPLSSHDQQSLEYVFTAFRQEGLDIQYRSGTGNWGGPQWAGFPSLKELVLESDLHGRPGNFLVTDEDYAFVRDLQRRNRIIPVVGNFSGTKALAAVADYLKKNGYTVSAFYTSNVEQYLFANGTFAAFV